MGGRRDPAMEEALHDMAVFHEFAGSKAGTNGSPTRAPSCGSGMCWRGTSWPHRLVQTRNREIYADADYQAALSRSAQAHRAVAHAVCIGHLWMVCRKLLGAMA